MMVQLLIVEDDAAIRVALSRALTNRGHAVASVASAAPALVWIESERPDVVILDLGLPDMDGLQLLRMVRAINDVPVIVATARDDERAVVAALDSGADDYVSKPFSAGQLDARIRAVLRRSTRSRASEPIEIGGLRIDVASREVHVDERRVGLNPKEFDLLLYLAERPGEVVTKRELVTQIWQQPYTGTDRTVDVHLSWLRSKLGESGKSPHYLQTVRGVGVKLTDGPGVPS